MVHFSGLQGLEVPISTNDERCAIVGPCHDHLLGFTAPAIGHEIPTIVRDQQDVSFQD